MAKCKFDSTVKCFATDQCQTCPIFKKTGQSYFGTKAEPTIKLKIESVDTSMKVLCPFCLHLGTVSAFLLSTKKGIDKRRGKCPECGNGMLLTSLLAEMTPEQYAEFVAGYVGYGFWQKIPYKIWSNRLHSIGWAYRFWKRYKAIKGESEEQETYEEYVQRKQREEWPKEDTDASGVADTNSNRV